MIPAWFLDALNALDQGLWNYISIPVLMTLGLLLTVTYRVPQFAALYHAITGFFKKPSKSEIIEGRGVKPYQAFFTAIGGCIGIGNIVAVCTAVQIGGPGATFWMWIAAFLGMMIKYSEVYLGIKFRVPNDQGSFDGGPMYYLPKAFKTPIVAVIAAVLLAFYCTDAYMFSVITESITQNWGWNKHLVVLGLLLLVIFAGMGGVKYVGNICSVMIPAFVVLYVGMCLWVLFIFRDNIPSTLELIFVSAFSPEAAFGGAAGSSILLTMYQGVARGCYSGDIGIGYASVVHAETQEIDPKGQARLAIFGIFLDTFVVCTASTILITVTGVWNKCATAANLVQEALATQFSMMTFFMPIFIFLLGYSTLIAFFVVGLKCADFLSPKYGRKFYYLFGALSFFFFSYTEQSLSLIAMSLSGALLLLLNVYGIFRLREHIKVR